MFDIVACNIEPLDYMNTDVHMLSNKSVFF